MLKPRSQPESRSVALLDELRGIREESVLKVQRECHQNLHGDADTANGEVG